MIGCRFMPELNSNDELYYIEVEGRLNLLLFIIEAYIQGVITHLELIQCLVDIIYQLE